jgi:NTE family protein
VESFKSPTVNRFSRDWHAYEIASQAFDAMQATIARQKLAAYPAEHIIEIAKNACGTLEFDRASEMIELGYNKAQESLG